LSNVLEIVLSKKIVHQLQGEYITLPFTVPDGIEEIKAELSYSKREENIIDLGMEDPEGFRGWSGGARTEIFIRDDRATPGYTIGEIIPGEWRIILNAYKVPVECDVKVKVSLLYSKYRWIKGDLHLHSNHSDGVFSVPEVIENIREAELEFLALTDHNTFSQNYNYPVVEDIAIIPGVELTTNRGHCNFYGIEKPFKDFRCKTVEDVKAKIEEGKSNGALVSINHPHCQFCSWDWGLENFDVEIVEIWNGPWSRQNAATLKWWDDQLKQGKKIVAIGGSDTHRPHETIKYGVPTNYIYAIKHSPKELLRALSDGKVCVAKSPSAPWIEVKIGDTLASDTYVIKGDEVSLSLKIKVPEFQGGIIKIITNQGILEEFEVKEGSVDSTVEIPPCQTYVRVEVWDFEETCPIVISNPIYFK
jgi:hypothetical protein